MEDVSRHAKRARVTRPSTSSADHAGGAGDLISGLGDDLLVRILESVAEAGARDVVRTDALSRRWRSLWTRVPALRFDLSPASTEKSAGGVERFIAFVDDVLALRARSDVGIKHLEISMHGKAQPVPPPINKAVEGWIRYALQRAVTSFVITLNDDDDDDYDDDDYHDEDDYEEKEDDESVMAVDLLPSSTRLETMCLGLRNARVRLQATVVFESLTNLTLKNIVVTRDSSHLLARFISLECCPRLQKLSMSDIVLKKDAELLVEARALLELSLKCIHYVRSMELRTPNLRVLHMEGCYDLTALTVSAPRLGKITSWYNPDLIHISGDLSHVCALNIELWSHGDFDDDTNDASINLLQRSSSARNITVDLQAWRTREPGCVDIVKDRIPPVHHVTSLAVDVSYGERHSFGDGVKSLLTRFNNLRHLRLQLMLYCSKKKDGIFVCDHPPNDWKSSDFSLAHLQEAEFKGLTGTGCELRFLQVMLASAKDLHKVIVGFNVEYCRKARRVNFKNMLLEAGSWTPSRDADESYEWRPS
ncbi:hypothetical protein ACP70R_024218 [Stipagrostis hirtigluma subsp. patula]